MLFCMQLWDHVSLIQLNIELLNKYEKDKILWNLEHVSCWLIIHSIALELLNKKNSKKFSYHFQLPPDWQVKNVSFLQIFYKSNISWSWQGKTINFLLVGGIAYPEWDVIVISKECICYKKLILSYELYIRFRFCSLFNKC